MGVGSTNHVRATEERPGAAPGQRPMSDECRDMVEADMVRILYRQLPLAAGANFLIVPIAAAIIWDTADHQLIALWAAGILAVAAIRLIHWDVFRRSKPADAELPRWARWHLAGAGASGLFWGLTAVTLQIPEIFAYEMFVAVLIAGMIAGASSAYSAYLPSFFAFALPTVVPTIVHALTDSDGMHVGLGVLFILYTALLSAIARNHNKLLFQSTRLQVERGRLLEKLSDAHRVAEAASRAKSAFLANMSHELRTPLNAVNGFSQIMKDQMFGPVGNERYRQYAELIHDSGSHLLQLIEDILDLSKIEAGHVELQEAPFDAPAVIANALELFRERARKHGVLLAGETGEDLPLIYGDERRFRQIILNLVSNAVKFTPRGGLVKVSATIDGDSGAFVFTVADSGVGIAAEDLPHIMAPFAQGSSQDMQHQGTGLGLPMVKVLAELHDGGFTLDSTPGEGTTAVVHFPAERVLTLPLAESA